MCPQFKSGLRYHFQTLGKPGVFVFRHIGDFRLGRPWDVVRPANSSVIVTRRSENLVFVWVRIFLLELIPPLNQKVLDVDDLPYFTRDPWQLRTNSIINFAR